MNDITNLEPKLMWKYFHEITQVPRPSKKEEKIREYLVDFGKKHGFETIVDQTGNVLIRKPATKGMENRKSVVLQSHMDMVCEKNSDVNFDFENDPIRTRIVDGWVKAEGTTLGADDGIGIAAAMAVLTDENVEHGPIEVLFTVDEETGLTGAFGMSNDLLKSKILLNLDSEDEGELFIGCAGGRDTIIRLPFTTAQVKNKNAFKISVGGLHGGHSGDDIHKGYANANKLLTRVLYSIYNKYGLQIAEVDGGNLRNAIAREAFAVVSTNASKEDLEKLISDYQTIFKAEYHKTEPELFVKVEDTTLPGTAIDDKSARNLILSLYSCPHGVLAMSQDIENFVETSTNLASVKLKDDHILITTSQRSSVGSALDSACEMVGANFLLAGAEVEHTDGYPGWTPNPDSEIVEISRKAYIDLFGKEPKVLAIHAGLECGLIGEKYPGMDMISFGPTIKGAHSPDEGIEIKTAQMFWDHLVEILKRIPEDK
jgi:dipeptidase D